MKMSLLMMRMMTLFSCCMGCTIIAHFETLQELQAYAHAYPEEVEIDNNDIMYPDFTSAYQKNRMGFFKKLGKKIGLYDKPEWNPHLFKDLVHRVTVLCEKTYVKDGEKIVTFKPDGRYVVWGDLFGAYHSLVRTLTKCREENIIDDSLKITADDCCFVFLGNVINRSPYSLETLTVVLTLMEKNPGKVFYLCGEQETNGYWENFTMRLALRNKASSIPLAPEDGSIPLSGSLNKLFDLLPKLFIIRDQSKGRQQAIYLIHRHISREALLRDEAEIMIFGSELFETERQSGLKFCGYNAGTGIWSLISCTNAYFKKFFKFYDDCFIILTMGEIVLKSCITAYEQKSDQQDNFTSRHYEMLLGIPIKTCDETNKIQAQRPYEIGSTGPLSGGSMALGTAIAHGINASVYNFNREHPVEDVYVRHAILDDQLIPNLAEKNVNTLQTYGSDVLVVPVGSSTLASYLDQIKSGKIAVLFPYAGDKQFRDASLKNMVHFVASYEQEVAKLIDYMISEYNPLHFAFFYQDDEYGREVVDLAHKDLQRRGIEKWTDIVYSPDTTDFVQQVAQLRQANPDAIGCFSTSASTQEFIGQVGANFFVGRHLFGLSFLESLDMRIFLKKMGMSMTFSYVVPNPYTSDMAIVKDYHKAMDFLKLPYDSNSLEGFIATELFFDALKHIETPITKEALIGYFEGLKNYNFKGLTLTFDLTTRSLGQPVLINTEDNKWVQ